MKKKLYIRELEKMQRSSGLFEPLEGDTVQAGATYTTLALGEEGGCIWSPGIPFSRPPLPRAPIVPKPPTTSAIGEEGGAPFII